MVMDHCQQALSQKISVPAQHAHNIELSTMCHLVLNTTSKWHETVKQALAVHQKLDIGVIARMMRKFTRKNRI
eukprot:UN4872